MENKLQQAFSNIKMSDACEEKILESFQKRPAQTRWVRLAAVATLCLLMMVLLFTNPNMVQALEDVLESVGNYLFHHGVSPDKHYTVYVTEPTDTSPSGEAPASGGDYFITVPQWLEAREDGLYFLANGEEIEIGSLITEEVPFTYTYTSGGMNYFIIVGGNYQTGGAPLEGVGWALFRQNAKKAETDPYGAWLSGYSAGVHDPVTHRNRPWYKTGKEILGIPFP